MLHEDSAAPAVRPCLVVGKGRQPIKGEPRPNKRAQGSTASQDRPKEKHLATSSKKIKGKRRATSKKGGPTMDVYPMNLVPLMSPVI